MYNDPVTTDDSIPPGSCAGFAVKVLTNAVLPGAGGGGAEPIALIGRPKDA
jgi:hypothetical protein